MNRSEAGKLGAKASLAYSKQLAKNNEANYLLSPRYCKQCNFLIPYAKRMYTFCNHSCASSYNEARKPKKIHRNRQQYVAERKATFYKEKIETGLCTDRVTLKDHLILLRGYACEICKNTVWNNSPIPLEIDHIDGYANNNFPANLRLLCPNCHAQTPTAKGRNKGKGRKSLGLPIS